MTTFLLALPIWACLLLAIAYALLALPLVFELVMHVRHARDLRSMRAKYLAEFAEWRDQHATRLAEAEVEAADNRAG